MINEDCPEIIPNRLYRRSILEGVVGRRCVEHLREAGLRAVGGWYLGEAVLESFRRAWQAKSCQRVPGKEKMNETEHEKKVEKDRYKREVHLAPKRRRSNDLLGQVEEVERLRKSQLQG